MKLKDVKVGDLVYIREDLEVYKIYGSAHFAKGMKQGLQKITSIDRDEEYFAIASEVDSFNFKYTHEMIDWEKTEELIYRAKKINDNVYNPSHYGGGGKHDIECYKAIEYILDRLENVPEKYYGHVSNVIKYIWRCNNKNGYEDLDKASVYLDFMFRKED